MIDVDRKSEPIPTSLRGDKYDGLDVKQALHRVFLGKCYLCETHVEAGTLSIDHRRPQGDRSERRHDWENLFPTCYVHNCNGRRLKKYPDGGLLDPSKGEVEGRLRQDYGGMPSRVLASAQCNSQIHFEAVAAEDAAARNTAIELDRIHNGTGSYDNAQLTAIALQRSISMRVLEVAERVRKLDTARLEASAEVAQARLELQILFSRRAPYTMLVRSVFAHRPDLRALFD